MAALPFLYGSPKLGHSSRKTRQMLRWLLLPRLRGKDILEIGAEKTHRPHDRCHVLALILDPETLIGGNRNSTNRKWKMLVFIVLCPQ